MSAAVLPTRQDVILGNTAVLPAQKPPFQPLPIYRRHGCLTSIGRIINCLRGHHDSRPCPVVENLVAELLVWIQQQDCIAGCVAWITRRDVLATLHQRRSILIVVQNEDYVQRFGTLDSSHSAASVYAFYQARNPGVPYGRYRTYGTLRDRASGRTVMHHKFLVGYTYVHHRGRWWWLPQSVWYGSWNFTHGSTNNWDSALIINDALVAEVYLQEWWRVWYDSDALPTG